MKKKLWALLLVVPILLSLMLPAFAQESGTVYRGIDVSKYQGQIDWNAVKSAGIQFAMIRTGHGGDPFNWDSEIDPYFESNYAGATAAGIKVGVYHYCEATDITGASNEADLCLHILNGRHLDYPVAYDVEDAAQAGISPETLGEMIQVFCGKLQQAGYRTVVYSYVNFYNAHLTSPLVSQYDTWIANYTQASAPNFSGKYTMWQYSSSGSVPGISGNCDMDYSYTDYSAGGPSNTPTSSTLDPMTFSCDTSSYTFTNNKQYTYKITTLDTMPPSASSSNPSAVSVSGPQATYHGFYFTLTNVGAGTATIKTTAADGRSVSFQATGTGTAQAPSTPSSPQNPTLRCDTSAYQFTPNGTYYYYKIWSTDSTAPTATSSNPAAVSVSYFQKLSDGYLYRLKNVGSGSAVITTKASGGASVSFTAVGNQSKAKNPTLRCDTSAYQFTPNSTYYCYKIWSTDSTAPTATSSNPAAVSVSYSQKLSDGYLYRLKNVGSGSAVITTKASGGASVSFTAVGNISAVTPPSDQAGIKSDTPFYFTMKKGFSYQFKFTPASGTTFCFACVGTSVVKPVSLQKSSGNYYYKISAVGKGTVGLYATAANGKPQRVCIVTVV